MSLFIINAFQFVTKNIRTLLILALSALVCYFSVVATSTVIGYKRNIAVLEKQLAESNGNVSVLQVRITNLEIAKKNLENAVATEIKDRQLTAEALAEYKKKSDTARARLQRQLDTLPIVAHVAGDNSPTPDTQIDAISKTYCIVTSGINCGDDEVKK